MHDKTKEIIFNFELKVKPKTLFSGATTKPATMTITENNKQEVATIGTVESIATTAKIAHFDIEEAPCCSRTLNDNQPIEIMSVDNSNFSPSIIPTSSIDNHEQNANENDVKTNNHKSTTNNENHSISRVSSNNSVNNSQIISTINLESDFIEAVMDDYKSKN